MVPLPLSTPCTRETRQRLHVSTIMLEKMEVMQRGVCARVCAQAASRHPPPHACTEMLESAVSVSVGGPYLDSAR